MKKPKLDKDTLGKVEVLSREQLKKVMGGNTPEGGDGGDHSCSVTCNTGKFACCNPGSITGMPTCKCHEEGGSPAPVCKDGGSGASSCSISVD